MSCSDIRCFENQFKTRWLCDHCNLILACADLIWWHNDIFITIHNARYHGENPVGKNRLVQIAIGVWLFRGMTLAVACFILSLLLPWKSSTRQGDVQVRPRPKEPKRRLPGREGGLPEGLRLGQRIEGSCHVGHSVQECPFQTLLSVFFTFREEPGNVLKS